MRRGRSSPWMRSMLSENRLHPSDFIWPLFVCDGRDCEEPIGSLPGVSRWSVDRLGAKAREAAELGIPCIALFPRTEGSKHFVPVSQTYTASASRSSVSIWMVR